MRPALIAVVMLLTAVVANANAKAEQLSAADEAALMDIAQRLKGINSSLERMEKMPPVQQARPANALPVIKPAVNQIPVSTNEAVCRILEGGSGTLIGWTRDKKHALVISCWHLCEAPSNRMRCVFKNAKGHETIVYPGRVTKVSSRYDLAAIIIPNPGIPPVVISDFQPYDGLYSACGYGGGRYSVARGKPIRRDQNSIETRVGIWPGHSGGGLFDPNGCYCGVTNWNDGSEGPNIHGLARSRSGEALQQFIRQATYECGVFTRWRQRRSGGGGGHSTCPPGGCPDISGGGGTTPGGGGYAQLAPGYQPIGGATIPGAAPLPAINAVAPPMVITPGVTPPATVTPGADPYNVPAPQGQDPTVVVQTTPGTVPATGPVVVTTPGATVTAVPATPAPGASPGLIAAVPETPTNPAAPAIPTGGSGPLDDYSRGIEELMLRQQREQAVKAALEAYQRTLHGGPRYAEQPIQPLPQIAPQITVPQQLAPRRREIGFDSELLERLDAIEQRLEIKRQADSGMSNPSEMLDRLPVVTMSVEYHDRTERAEVDLVAYVRKQLGLVNVTPEE